MPFISEPSPIPAIELSMSSMLQSEAINSQSDPCCNPATTRPKPIDMSPGPTCHHHCRKKLED